MKKTIFVLLFLALSTCIVSAQAPSHIYFTTGSSVLSPEAKETLDGFFETLNLEITSKVEIVAHTDNVGEEAFNNALSAKRAKAAQAYLIEKGLNKEQFALAAYGESQPIASNTDEVGRRLNRRVSFALGDGTFAWVTPAESWMDLEKDKLRIQDELEVEGLNARERAFRSLVNTFRKPAQQYRIETQREFRIRTKNGTLLYIPANVFEPADGSQLEKHDEVYVEVREYFERSEMLLGNLNSMSPQGLMESGGMFEINAYSKDKKLSLKNGRKIEIYIPTAEEKEGMMLFNTITPQETELVVNFWELDTTWNIPDTSRTYEKKEIWWLNKGTNQKWEDLLEDPQLISIGGDTIWQNNIPVIINKRALLRKPRPIPSVYRIKSKPSFFKMNIGRLGWINCDRFILDNRPKTDVFVKLDQDQPMLIKMIFKNINAIMPGSAFADGYMNFKNLPIGQEVMMLAVVEGEGEESLRYALKELTIEPNLKIDELDLQSGSKTELEQLLAAKLD